MQLKHYVWVIWRWSWLILLGTLICAGATYILSKRTPPVYEASAFVQVNGAGATDSNSVFSNQALAVSYALEVTNNDVLQAASRELPGMTVGDLRTAVNAFPLDNTQIIEVQADATDAHQAADIANTVAQVFIQQQIAREYAIDQRAAQKLSGELITAKANVDSAQAQLTKLETAQASSSEIAHQKDVLDNYQVNYDTLSASYNQIQLHESLVDGSLTISQSAVPPTTAKGPRVLLNTGVAAGMGLLLTVIFALLLDWLDTTIKTSEDVAQLATLEPLGSVPLCRVAEGQSPVNDPAVEQAFVPITMSFKARSGGRRAILITGLRSGTGISMTASRLAQALAQAGLRVLLIDANRQRPTQQNTFKSPPATSKSPNLSNTDVLRRLPVFRHEWLQQWATDVPNLFLLPAGSLLEQAETIRWASKLQMLTASFLQPTTTAGGETPVSDIDLIVFDAPALDAGADAIALASIADGTVLVIEAGKERAESLHKAQATLQRLGSPILGVVVNRQRANHRTYFYAQQQQVAVALENADPDATPRYPALQTRTNLFQVEVQSETSLPGLIQREPTAPLDGEPEVERTIPLPRLSGAILAPSHSSQTNNARPGNDHHGQRQ